MRLLTLRDHSPRLLAAALITGTLALAGIEQAPPERSVKPAASDAVAAGHGGTAFEAGEDSVGVAVYAGDRIIRGYDPTPMLVVPVTAIARARHPVIDIHCHWWLARSAPAPEAMLAAMDEHNVAVAVNLSGGFGDGLAAMLAWCSVAPTRLLVFANIDFSRIDQPDFVESTVKELRDAHARGARGLKIFKDLGLTLRNGRGDLLTIDDPRLDAIWALCGELKWPVLIHSGDPAAFFEPIDGRNERWMQLARHPDWSFHGPQFPSRETLFEQRERVFGRHPGTTFIAAHLGDLSEDLARASALLEAHPNVVMDLSGRVAELGRQPYSARRFLIRHQDRILFGTDRYPGRTDQPRYQIYSRFLETADEYFKYYENDFPPTGEWRIYGVDLPDDVLRKIYFENAARVLGVPAIDSTAPR